MTRDDPGGMSHLTVVPENFDPERNRRRSNDERGE
jgi:hypothetical protein